MVGIWTNQLSPSGGDTVVKERTVGQYRAIDLIMFSLMVLIGEWLVVNAAGKWFPDQLYVFSITPVITAIVMMRWGPWAAIHAALGGAVLCNVLIPLLYPSVYWMALVWGVNGFFQSLIRPPLGRIIAANYDQKGYINTCVAVSNSSQVATVLTYLVIPLCLQLSDNNWRLAFHIPVVVGVITLICWFLIVPRICGEGGAVVREERKDAAEPLVPVMLRSGLLLFILPVLIHGLLRDGITAWMPDFICEVGGWNTGASILTTAILPAFCIVCVIAAKKICARIPSNGMSSALFFVVSCASAAIILPLLKTSGTAAFVVIVVLMALITGCMHAVNHIFITRIPGAFRRVGRVSGVVGVLNAVTYVGSALSPYLIAVVAKENGWGTAVFVWMILAAVSVVLCMAASRKWQAFEQSQTV